MSDTRALRQFGLLCGLSAYPLRLARRACARVWCAASRHRRSSTAPRSLCAGCPHTVNSARPRRSCPLARTAASASGKTSDCWPASSHRSSGCHSTTGAQRTLLTYGRTSAGKRSRIASYTSRARARAWYVSLHCTPVARDCLGAILAQYLPLRKG